MQEVKKASGTPGRVAQDVSDRRNRWERGDVISSGEKVAAKKVSFFRGNTATLVLIFSEVYLLTIEVCVWLLRFFQLK